MRYIVNSLIALGKDGRKKFRKLRKTDAMHTYAYISIGQNECPSYHKNGQFRAQFAYLKKKHHSSDWVIVDELQWRDHLIHALCEDKQINLNKITGYEFERLLKVIPDNSAESYDFLPQLFSALDAWKQHHQSKVQTLKDAAIVVGDHWLSSQTNGAFENNDNNIRLHRWRNVIRENQPQIDLARAYLTQLLCQSKDAPNRKHPDFRREFKKTVEQHVQTLVKRYNLSNSKHPDLVKLIRAFSIDYVMEECAEFYARGLALPKNVSGCLAYPTPLNPAVAYISERMLLDEYSQPRFTTMQFKFTKQDLAQLSESEDEAEASTPSSFSNSDDEHESRGPLPPTAAIDIRRDEAFKSSPEREFPAGASPTTHSDDDDPEEIFDRIHQIMNELTGYLSRAGYASELIAPDYREKLANKVRLFIGVCLPPKSHHHDSNHASINGSTTKALTKMSAQSFTFIDTPGNVPAAAKFTFTEVTTEIDKRYKQLAEDLANFHHRLSDARLRLETIYGQKISLNYLYKPYYSMTKKGIESFCTFKDELHDAFADLQAASQLKHQSGVYSSFVPARSKSAPVGKNRLDDDKFEQANGQQCADQAKRANEGNSPLVIPHPVPVTPVTPITPQGLRQPLY